MEEFMKGSGSKIWDMGEAMKDIKMGMYIWDHLRQERHMARVSILGRQHRKYMMGSGWEGSDRDMEYGRISREIATLENGRMEEQ